MFLLFIKIISGFFILYLMMSGSPLLIYKYSTGGRFLYQLISVLLKSGGEWCLYFLTPSFCSLHTFFSG
ncbi:hypothetical protein GIJ38_16195 [Morganella morganii]|nr:hypothetical protein [Morganella morganii]